MKKHIYGYPFLKFSKESLLMKFFAISFVILVFLSCKNASNPVKKDLKEITREIMKEAKACALITMDSLGIAHARAMDPFLPEEDFTVWMATNPKSLKVQQLKNNKKVTLYYFDKESVSYVSLQGVASIINAKKEKENFWKTAWKNFYKNRTTEYLLIKFTPKKANIVSERYQILGDSITWETAQLNF
jgi:general stress protein 26